jgi:hypothetical protein
MAEKTSMLDTFEKEGFMYLTGLIRESSVVPADSGSCPLNRAWSLRLGCIVFDLPFGNLNVRNMIISHPLASAHWAFSQPCRLPAILFCTDVSKIITEGLNMKNPAARPQGIFDM